MNGAEGVLVVNIGVACLFSGGYAILAIANPSQRAALGFAVCYLIGMVSPLSDLAAGSLGAPVVTEWISYVSFLMATLSVSIAYPLFHGAKAPWWAVSVILALGLLSRASLNPEPQETLAYGLAYQIPFALAAVLAARTVLKLEVGGRPLTLALGAVFALIAANLMIKPVLSLAFGAGRTLATYTQSPYAMVSQVSTGILLLAAGLLMLLIVAQKAITESQVASETDPLSGLLNRRGFDRLAQTLVSGAQAAGRPVSAAVFDLDHFKHINDVHGHEVGDAVIAATASVLRGGAPAGALVCRMGGEEFALLLQGLSAAETRRRIEPLRAALSSLPLDLPRVTASCGIAQRRPDETLSDLMRRADIAAYEAKRTGRDRLCEAADETDGVVFNLSRLAR
ncbi:MAG: GGDEF domain-containing protein [Alphaproteobacteria bacterium]|nr:GGDEF domain-containing protein [Alphaproteobacteria bacterium]MBU1513848.1 GGDEF domain-containing protein [Alphaproteobacteria bacterium]MBU2094507.1 GGDEF domain-containing protein [Alphaproteobacteria bacterium]MBU2151232.1 GGDEF domain-containing protein [Alphaproteobacteria bacterium]MBU2310047.1 GGDEF domain-containing protein [Alphaproteobacteria bacterium]